MNSTYRCLTCALGALALAAAAGGQAFAQSYPAGPVRIIVPFPAGGGVDGTGRLVGQKLTEALGKQFVIDPKTHMVVLADKK